MKKMFNIAALYLNLVFILILVYAYQDINNSANIGLRDADRGIVHILLFIVICILSIYYLYTSLTKGIVKDSVEGSLWLISGWIFSVGLIQDVNMWSLLVHLGLSVLWIVIYHFGKGYMTQLPFIKKSILRWIVLLFMFYVFSAIYASISIKFLYDRLPVINLSYNVIVFYPWIFLLSSDRLKKFFSFIVLLVVLMSFKRGAIIIYPSMVIISSIVHAKIENRKTTGIAKSVFFTILFLYGLIIADNFSGGFLSNRFIPESLLSGSGRNDLFRLAIDNIASRGFCDLMIGLGSGSSIQYLGTSVHNEWLEFIYSFGIIGVILYAKHILTLIARARKYIQKKSNYAPAYTSMIVYMIIVGLFGGLYFVHSTMYVMMFLGLIDGLVLKEG
jgi:hypothetical protein